MVFPDPGADGAYHIRFASQTADTLGSTSAIVALRDYLEQCDARSIAPDCRLHLSAADRLTRRDIVTALPLCINIIRIGTTLVLPGGETFGRDDINTSLSLKLVLALATLDEMSRGPGAS
jgi:hypothetical protein